MSNIFTNIDLVIFDLDGTLYEDTDHFDYYAEQLKLELPENLQTAFQEEYKKMLAGHHIVTIGKVYDVVRDHVLKLDSSNGKVTDAWKWDGTELTSKDIQEFYSQTVSLDFDSMIAIGDGWWLPNVCAKHFGVVDTYTSYVKTKDFMATDQFQLTKIPGLRNALQRLKSKKDIVLVTNSQEEDVHRLLNLLDLEGIFDDIVTEARKPQYTINHFSDLIQKYGINSNRVLSIGDNFLNEIAPALQMGMKTVFIDLYEFDYPEYRERKIKSITELITDMNE